MNSPLLVSPKRCAVYCRVSSDERLDQSFNSIDAQKEAGHAFIKSQSHEGWIAVADDYDDGGFSGGNMDRPGIKRLMADVAAGKVDFILVYTGPVLVVVLMQRWFVKGLVETEK